jgi:hypothetical protein
MSGPHQHRTLRDPLLPKLLSGEWGVTEASATMEASA